MRSNEPSSDSAFVEHTTTSSPLVDYGIAGESANFVRGSRDITGS
jgi:hypothetical protein